ncbi:MAG: SOS response-associated peptidase [Bacteroidia bacterium]|nr:SOS response-associated peptidase [Bacteroidia bacterium]
MEKRAQRIAQHYAAAFSNDAQFEIQYQVSGFTHPLLPVITMQQPQTIQAFTWGLIPYWCKQPQQAKEIAAQTLNAKCETIFEKPSYRKAIAGQRCLLIVNGFYEWQTANKIKYPYYIQLKNSPFFSLGAVYDTWLNTETQSTHHTFSVVTVPANTLMQQIHNTMKRMPLILTPDTEKKWLQPNLDKPAIAQLMLPFDPNQMQAHTIARYNNSHNHANIQQPYTYPELDLYNA